MPLLQLIYTSQPFGFDEAMLAGILLDARRCNKRDGITGALVCRSDIYMQLLEGEADKVNAALARIIRDDRHLDVQVRVSRDVTERSFGEWEMLHDPAKSWLWDITEVADGAVDRAAPEEFVGLFETLAAKVAAGHVG